VPFPPFSLSILLFMEKKRPTAGAGGVGTTRSTYPAIEETNGPGILRQLLEEGDETLRLPRI